LAALAQPASPPSTTVAPVTVEAAAKPQIIEKEAHTFVQGYAAAQNPEVDQIGRWYDPVCAIVVGLPSDGDAAKIKARIESVAQSVGLPVPRAGCIPNVDVVFTDHPQLAMDMVAKRREYLLGYYHLHLRDELKKVTHPIQSWYVTATRGSGTGNVALAFSEFDGFSQQQTEVIDDPWNQPPNGCSDSPHATACLKSIFRNVFIVADSKALQGRDLGLVADYIVMLALSEPRSLDRCNPFPSVLDLFSRQACAAQAPDGMTPSDAAYLTALYASDLQAKKSGEQNEIANRMAKILVNANAGGK
jgi:hypothetical protein